MNPSKTLVLTLLVCFASIICNAQTSIEGEYISSQEEIKQVFIKQKKGGYLLGTWIFERGNSKVSYMYKPIKGSKTIFEAKVSGGYSRLDISAKDYIVELDLRNNRKVYRASVLARKKKYIRKFRKKVQAWSGQIIVQDPTSAFHQKNASKIVFFSEKPVIGKEDFSKVKTSFKAGDPIWAVAYLPRPLDKYSIYMNRQQELKFAMGTTTNPDGLDVENIGGHILRSLPTTAQERAKNYMIFQVYPDDLKKTAMNSLTAKNIAEAIQALEPTDYTMKVRFEYEGMRSNDIAGVFTLDCSEGREKAKQTATVFAKAYWDRKQLPKPAMTDPALEQEILKTIQRFSDAAGWNVQFKKVVITLPTWQTLIDPNTGAIRGRIIEAACTAKWPNRDCGYQYFTFIQEHQGGGKYAEGLRRYSSGYRAAINCQNIK